MNSKKIGTDTVLALILIIAIVVIGRYSIYRKEQRIESNTYSVEETKGLIEQMMVDVYAPKSMEQFKQSYSNNTNKIVTKDVADKLYVASGDELTEADLKRSCNTVIAYSPSDRNSDGKDEYIVKLYLYNSGKLSASAEIIFGISGSNGSLIDTMEMRDVNTKLEKSSDG